MFRKAGGQAVSSKTPAQWELADPYEKGTLCEDNVL